MATSNNLQCSICLEDFKQPKFLDCFHTFCLECLRGLENKTPGFINCPLCQRKIQLPPGGVDKLTTNFFIQDKPLVGVEGGEIVPRGVDNEKGLQNVQKGVSECKTFELRYPAAYYSTSSESFCGVFLEFSSFKNKTEKWGETLALRINLSKKMSPFVISCQVVYGITLVNQKDKKFSVKRTGQGDFETIIKLSVDLIKMSYAADSDYGFIVKETSTNTDRVYQFELNINIIVSNIKHIDFNLK